MPCNVSERKNNGNPKKIMKRLVVASPSKNFAIQDERAERLPGPSASKDDDVSDPRPKKLCIPGLAGATGRPENSAAGRITSPFLAPNRMEVSSLIRKTQKQVRLLRNLEGNLHSLIFAEETPATEKPVLYCMQTGTLDCTTLA